MRVGLRYVVGVVVLVAVGSALAYAFRLQPVLVDLAEVDRGPLAETVREEGYTRVREIYVVSAPIAGRVARLQAEVGDEVATGATLLASIRPSDPALLDVRSQSEAEAAVRSAEANLALARAEVARVQAQDQYAQADVKRAMALAQRGIISAQSLERRQLDLDDARAALAAAEAAVRARTAELEQARARLLAPMARLGGGGETVELHAPIDGRVLRVLQESETVVAAGMPLLELGDPRELEIVVELLSTDAVRLRAGAPVRIYDWGGGENLAGRIRRVEPFGFTKVSALGIEEQRVRVLVDFAGPPPAGLGHGYRVEIEAEVWSGADVLRVPIAALFRAGTDWAVFVVDADNRATLRRIDIGHMGEVWMEALEGLEAGATIVLHPDERIEDGIAVAPRVPEGR